MLAAAGSMFGLFLLSSLYLQNVLGMGPLSHRTRVHPARAHGGQSARTRPATSSATTAFAAHSPAPSWSPRPA